MEVCLTGIEEQHRLHLHHERRKSCRKPPDDLHNKRPIDPCAFPPQQVNARRAAGTKSCELSRLQRVLVPNDHLRQQRLDHRIVADEGNV
jgi:hypothetical protein